MRVTFEWQIDPDPSAGVVYVIERVQGMRDHRRFGPLPPSSAEAFIRARRAAVERLMKQQSASRVSDGGIILPPSSFL